MCMYIEELSVLQKTYTALNKHYFAGLLPSVVITIQSDLGAYGHYVPRGIWNCADSFENDSNRVQLPEINLSAENLKRSHYSTCATLMHEMCHHFCFVNGMKDTSRQGRYHNKIFKQVAEERGLVIGYAKNIGWSLTEPTNKFKEFIDGLGYNFQCLYRDTLIEDPKETKASKVYKYQCPVCGLKVRTNKASVRIRCMDCNELLQPY